jgi:hypothetical protein
MSRTSLAYLAMSGRSAIEKNGKIPVHFIFLISLFLTLLFPLHIFYPLDNSPPIAGEYQDGSQLL